MKILSFAGSPRRNGNTRILLKAFTDECSQRGHEIETVDLANTAKWRINACIGCDRCLGGKCIQKDSMQEIYPKIAETDAIVLAAPVYFYGLPSQAKAMIDRCQLFFNMKYRREEPIRTKPGKGLFISVGATKGSRLFDGELLTIKYWYDAIGVDYVGEALLKGVDEPGAILQHPEAIAAARHLVDYLE